jgi:acetyl esterase
MKLKRKMISILLFSVLSIIIVALLAVNISPKPMSYLTRAIFDHSEKAMLYPRKSNYEELKAKVVTQTDLIYPSEHKNNSFDLILPKGKNNVPILFWVHGGAFVGGDKRDCLEYLEMIAAHGYAVVNMNYERTPEVVHPTPIKQMTELVRYVASQAEEHSIDLQRVFIGGDSAGAQIAGEFTNVQNNPAVQESLHMKPVLKSEQIKGYISFSGLLNLKEYDETDSGLGNFLFRQTAWAYFEDRSWKESTSVAMASLIGNITASFPPTYMTDGNTNSFEKQMPELKTELEKWNIPVEMTYFTKEAATLQHEYQFDFSIKEANVNFDHVVLFLENYKDRQHRL